MISFDDKLQPLLGKKSADALETGLGLTTVGDLLRHYPRRYDERGKLTDIRSLEIDEHVTVQAEVRKCQKRQMKARRGQMTEAVITDGTSELHLVFFGKPAFVAEQELLPGTRALFAGKVGRYRQNLQLVHPAFEVLTAEQDGSSFLQAFLPVYPASQHINTWNIANCVKQLLEIWDGVPEDPLPADFREEQGLIGLEDALRAIHRPESWAQISVAQLRLKWDEALAVQLALAQRRKASTARPAPACARRSGGILDAFDARLPFTLTAGQVEVGEQVASDLESTVPMNRLLQGEVGSGKAQPLDSLVLTPTGFIKMGEVRVGDEVIAPNGEITVVTGVFPQGERDVYRVVLSDGRSVESDLEHLWAVNTTVRRDRGNPLKVLTLREIRDDLTTGNKSSKWYLPVLEAPELDCVTDRPLDPYALGLLIGDGSLLNGRVMFTSADPELLVELMAALPKGAHLVKPEWANEYDWFVNGCRKGTNPVLDALRALGVYGHRARDKFLPENYMVAPVKVRHALLQGLLDTDGTLDHDQGSNVTFLSASPRLADQVSWLAESLGGTGRVRPVEKMGNTYHLVSLRLPNEFPPFRLTRKAELVKERTKYEKPVRAIRAVEFVGRKPVQCISVAHPDQLYVTDHFIVTHNTMVALRAMLQAVDAGRQSAMLAPTEVLAAQHARSLTEMLGDLAQAGQLGGAEDATRVTLLTGSMNTAQRRQALLDIVTGEAGIVVGTHAIIQEKVEFHSLGLVVVDEQHRFGVEQRAALSARGERENPHVLVMTATPIPRTVAMTVYGDLEVSALRELPGGRSPIKTSVVPVREKPTWLDRAFARVREEVAKGHQAYFVCPRIGDEEPAKSDDEDKRPALSVIDVATMLAQGPLRGLRIEILHGRMPPDEKDAVMRAFAANEVHVLVATTVIEVGVNVPNATVMAIMDADRFGVSQLHQLRGRVGRGSAPGLCLLVTEMPEMTATMERLRAVESTLDGFELAQLDLELRREGDILGAAQSGRRSGLKMLSLLRDEDIIADARTAAQQVVDADPDLEQHPGLAGMVATLLTEERAEYLEKT
ncbi:ATP-dependent DNA helicase RecG [Lentzea flaviverrucosa]|uniref:Probable DNA 3'-5' helicase RecG n=1 Tax=Lentzea flaviverrucosa TaxID=200379 RepID=A0A1H9R1C4_9PSEU|nr:ATP-dependent DNA helicase RecG [Lentzea flaviverrucosa]SER66546.1 ATP-dependent DNA helicase RecG [Lentzea flaviverrucosa]